MSKKTESKRDFTSARGGSPEVVEGNEVRARCRGVLNAILRDERSGELVFVTHGSPVGQCMAEVLGHTEGVDFRMAVRMAAITELEQSEHGFHLHRSGSDHLRVLDEIGRLV